MKNSKEYLDKIVNIIEKPYFYEMRLYGITDLNEVEYILRKVHGNDIRISLKFGRNIFDSNGNVIYYENEYNDGFWSKWEYDSNNILIYYESNGFMFNNR